MLDMLLGIHKKPVQASTANIYPPKLVLHRRNPYFTIIANIMHYYG